MWSAIRRLFGGGGGGNHNNVEWCVFQMENSQVRPGAFETSVCLTPEIVDGTRLVFRTSPHLRNAATGHNPLGRLRDSIDVEAGERLIIKSISRIHVHSELDADLRFEITNLFDRDAETQQIRDKIDAAVLLDAGSGVTVTARKRRHRPLKSSSVVRLEAPSDDDSAIQALEGGSDEEDSDVDPGPFHRVSTAEEALRRADATPGLSGGDRPHRNRVERTNRVQMGLVEPCKTRCVTKQLYRCSVSDDIVRWFAGQDRMIADNPMQAQFSPQANPDPSTRAERPVIDSCIYPSSHALIFFIRMFSDALAVKSSEIVVMKGDRDDQSRWYRVSVDLVKRAREMVLYVVYAQIYYTTLRECTLTRVIDNDAQEYALVMRLASQWGLTVHPKTKRVSDWEPEAYRPVVVITLRVEYFVVNNAQSSAAALYKKRTVLSAV